MVEIIEDKNYSSTSKKIPLVIWVVIIVSLIFILRGFDTVAYIPDTTTDYTQTSVNTTNIESVQLVNEDGHICGDRGDGFDECDLTRRDGLIITIDWETELAVDKPGNFYQYNASLNQFLIVPDTWDCTTIHSYCFDAVLERYINELNDCGSINYGFPSYPSGSTKEGEGCAVDMDCLFYPPSTYTGYVDLNDLTSSPTLFCCISDNTCYWS